MAVNPPDSSDSPETRDGADLRLVETPTSAPDGTDTSIDRPSSPKPGGTGERSELGKTDEPAEAAGASVPRWLFVLTLLLSAGIVFWQVRHAGELEARMVGLEEELARANALVEAHRTHLGEIRGGMHALSARVQALRDLVDRDPATASEGSLGSDAPVLLPSSSRSRPEPAPLDPP